LNSVEKYKTDGEEKTERCILKNPYHYFLLWGFSFEIEILRIFYYIILSLTFEVLFFSK